MNDVAILCEYPTLSGGERSMLATLGGVRAAGFSVEVFAPPRGPLACAFAERDIEVVPFSIFDATNRRAAQSALRAELDRLLRDRRPRLLHANSLAMGRLAGPVAAELRLPSIAHLRDILRLSPQAAADLNCHTRLLAVSAATRACHVAAGLDPAKTHVLHNGVDLAQFCPRPRTGELHRELGLPADSLLVGAVGQIGLRKGFDVLARAAELLAGELPHMHYVIAGERWSDKDESRRFEAQLRAAAAGPLAGRLHLVGYRADMPRFLNELDLLAHPARQEPLGRVLLEAAAAGKPIIATDVGGTREIFPLGAGAADLVPPDDPQSLAHAIRTLMLDPARRAALSAAARRRAEDAFGSERAVAGLVRHYRDVAAEASEVAG